MTAPTTKIHERICTLLDDLHPSEYWYAVLEAAYQLGDPLAEPPSKDAVARILAAFAAEGGAVAAAIAAAKPSDDEPSEGWEERAMERWRREAKPPRS